MCPWTQVRDADAITEGQPIHSSADRQLWHRKENRVELFGHAVVSQPGETLTADYITMDMNTRLLDARGHCVYVAPGSVIRGEEMHFNLDTRTGTVVGGRVSNDQFSLSGERINKLGAGHFQTHRGEYTTCQDCPGSWSLLADDVDMQIEGYAYMDGVTGKITDTPAFWLPYLIMPMKTRRQTGFLFPNFSLATNNGVVFMVPFFWAINRSLDMSLAVGDYTKRGPRVEWEGRYALDGGAATVDFNFVRDSQFNDMWGRGMPSPDRWSLNVTQSHALPWGIEEKLRIQEVSDNLYPWKLGEAMRNNDVVANNELSLESSLNFSYANPELSAYVGARWYRTLINTVPEPILQVTQADPRTVQVVPKAALTTREWPLFGSPLVAGLSLGLVNFTRSRDAFDYDKTSVPFGVLTPDNPPAYNPGVDPIRKATRLSLTPSLYTTIRPFDLFSLVPSVKGFGYFYSFPSTDRFKVPDLARYYVLTQLDLSTQLERVYDIPSEKDAPRLKHLIRPVLTYSYIPSPLIRESWAEHPFLQQIRNAGKNGTPGYYFDNYDVVQRDASAGSTNYYIPLGNSLALGLTSQLIRRLGAFESLNTYYLKFLEVTAGEAINFREYHPYEENAIGDPILIDPNHPELGYQPHTPHPFSRLFTTMELNLPTLRYTHTYYYYPYMGDRVYNQYYTGALTYWLTYPTVHRGIFSYNRSLTLNYTWDQVGNTDPSGGTSVAALVLNYSVSDYLLPTLSLTRNFLTQKFQAGELDIQIQSPSRCWKFTLSMPYDLATGLHWNVDMALNITGSGYGGVTEMAAQTGVLK